jgi:hypothetical protein
MSLVILLPGELLKTKSSPFCGAPFGDQFAGLLKLPEPAVQVRTVAKARGSKHKTAREMIRAAFKPLPPRVIPKRHGTAMRTEGSCFIGPSSHRMALLFLAITLRFGFILQFSLVVGVDFLSADGC